MKKTYIVLSIIAAVTLLVYNLLPNMYFEESVFPLQENVTVIGYDDVTDGGESVTHFSVDDSALSFDCTLGADTTKGAWCGILWNMDPKKLNVYRNWTFVDSLIFDVETQGTNEVLLKVWTFDPDVTDAEKPKTFRLLMKEVPLQKGRHRVAVAMEQLYTPDFWFDDAKADRELNRRHQETVARIEIAPGWNQPRGKFFSLKFYDIRAIGLSNIAFGVVLFIFLALTIVAVGRRHHFKNEEKK